MKPVISHFDPQGPLCLVGQLETIETRNYDLTNHINLFDENCMYIEKIENQYFYGARFDLLGILPGILAARGNLAGILAGIWLPDEIWQGLLAGIWLARGNWLGFWLESGCPGKFGRDFGRDFG